MLARRRLLPPLHSRLKLPCEPWATRLAVEWHAFPTRALQSGRALLVSQQQQQQQSSALSTASVARGVLERTNAPLGATEGSSRARFASTRAVKVAHGSRVETPTIPSLIEIRELASLLRVKPKVLFKSLGGYQEKKMHRVVLSGVPYAFPKLGNIIVPFQDARSVAHVLNKPIRFLDVEKKPERTTLAVPSGVHAWEEGASDGGGRRPVVVLLGHFNHGKTTILDALLGPGSGIAEREAGGITQEIRARTVSLKPSQGKSEGLGDSREVVASEHQATVATFLDTPGQEIFYRMRTNGARVADAVLLVVSAVDGICLQTSESIGCAEELGLPAVVALNKIDLLPAEEAAQRVKELSQEVREFVAIENAKVLPLSARTGHGLDDLRTSLAAALGRRPSPPESPLSVETPRHPRPDALEPKHTSLREVDNSDGEAPVALSGAEIDLSKTEEGVETDLSETAEGVDSDEVAVMEAPEGAATATVLDYTSSAKTGKLLLVLVDRGVLRPGDFFVSGSLWGSVRSIFDEEGITSLQCAGPGVAAKVVVVARSSVSDAPLGEPFRVLAKESAQKVALVRALTRTMDGFVDHRRLERDFPHLLQETASGEADLADEPHGPEEPSDCLEEMGSTGGPSAAARNGHEQRKGLVDDDDDDLSPEEMPVTIVVKADSANTLASILDALGDWGDVEHTEDSFTRDSQETSEEYFETSDKLNLEGGGASEKSNLEGGGASDESKLEGGGERVQKQRQEWGESDLQHKQRRRLIVSVARSGVGAVTSSDVYLARDCECPVFAHNVRADATASRELRRVGGGVVPAIPEGTVADGVDVGVGGEEGFIGRAGEGRECVVVSETVGELLGEIERFVLRVR